MPVTIETAPPMNQSIQSHSRIHNKTIIGLLCLAYTIILTRTAWICDDAYITLRTVDNFTQGHGLRWNPLERVQTYTHPLWLFLLSSIHIITREVYYTTVSLSIIVSVSAFFLVLTGCRQSIIHTIMCGTALICSKSFTDYSTSGLENPLTHLLLVIFIQLVMKKRPSRKWSFICGLTACLGILNRLDTILIFILPLTHYLIQLRNLKCWVAAGLGLFPLVAWELFSLIYYGFPFPNTAYAKLMGDIPLMLRLDQAFYSFAYLLIRDPQTILILAVVPAMVLYAKIRAWIPLCLGILLYLAYIIWIGGDFMGGRFFTTPFLMAVIMAGRLPGKRFKKPIVYLTTTTIILGITMPLSPLKSGSDYGHKSVWHGRDDSGVNDERGFYYNNSGLLRSSPGEIFPDHEFARRALELISNADKPVFVADMGPVGYAGYFGGKRLHLVDHYGLVDPLIARLPGIWLDKWRTGHTHRMVPRGYLKTLRTGQNQIENLNLAKWYDHVLDLTRSPLTAPGRIREIIRFNLGEYDHLLQNIPVKDLEYFPGTREYFKDPSKIP